MKPWYKSRTLIVNAAVAVGLPVINAILRVITTQGVVFTGKVD